jgi:ATP-dependent DNA helicase RecG
MCYDYLRSMKENQTLEFKQSWHDDHLKWICGFANANGGKMIIGRQDNGKIIGLDNGKKLLEVIPNKIRDLMGIICEVILIENETQHFIEISVPTYSVPVSLRGRYYMRSGSNNYELTGVELNEFLLKQAGKSWDDIIEEGATVDDVDKASIKRFIQDSKAVGRLPDTNGLSTLQMLEKLNLSVGTKLKRAAIILFGKKPSRFFPNMYVKIGRFGKDGSDLLFHEIVEGNLIHLLHEIIGLLEYKFLTKRILFEGIQRFEMEIYPSQAIREMLLNALVHRTQIGSPIQIRIFDEQISIWNEGNLPNGLSVEDLRMNHNSRPRNPIIANACFLAGYIDTWGRGTLKIINSCFEYGLSAPTIIEKNGGVEVTLFSTSHLQKGGQTTAELGGQTQDKKGGQTAAELGGQTQYKKGGQTAAELGGQTQDKKGGQTTAKLGGQTQYKKGGQTTVKLGGQTQDKKGGQTTTELGDQTQYKKGEQTASEFIEKYNNGGQNTGELGGQTQAKKGGQTTAELGGQTQAKKGGQTTSELGGQTQGKKGGQTTAELGGQTQDKKGGQTAAELGGQTQGKKGGQTAAELGGQTQGKKGGQTTAELGEQTTLTPRQMTILNSIHNNPRITRKELAETLAVNESAIQKHLKTLVDSGRLKRIGTYKGKWVIMKRKKLKH